MNYRLALISLLVLGCNNSTPGKSNQGVRPDSSFDAATGADVTGGNGSASTDGSASGSDATSTTDGGGATDDGPWASTAYREPESIRGGACADTTTAEACRGGAPAAVYCSLEDPTRVVMAVCMSTSRGNQCEAMDDCGAGWSACTATQYVERGGRDVKPDFSTTNRAWLAACVQDAGGQTLRNEPCAPCTDFDPAYDPAVMWWCDDGSVVYEGGMDGDRLGVVTSPECFRVGANTASNGAWWALDFAGSGPSFVVCCDDEF